MIRIGIICPSEIAYRRFLPSLQKLPEFEFVGIASANQDEWENADNILIEKEKEKAKKVIAEIGGKLYGSYSEILESNDIDAVYLPLPPALHYKWAKHALTNGKHVLIEKPATTTLKYTLELTSLAKKNGLALHENYMFAYHNQLGTIKKIIESEEIGDVRLYKITFGFPRKAADDFRFNKALGGGALLDAGGYVLKYASMLLGETAELVCAQSNYIKEFDVDIAGSATLINQDGVTVQVAFGMDNSYKCDLEVWGSKGSLFSGRILTAPVEYIPNAILTIGNISKTIELPEDDAFKKSIEQFHKCIKNENHRMANYKEIIRQAGLVNDFQSKAKRN